MNTEELYEKFNVYFDVGDKVIFILKRGYKIEDNGRNFPRTLYKSADERHLEKVRVKILDYRPSVPGNLDIDCESEDGIGIRIKLSQCANLELLI